LLPTINTQALTTLRIDRLNNIDQFKKVGYVEEIVDDDTEVEEVPEEVKLNRLHYGTS